MAPGSGAPTFVFTGTGATTGINNRRWAGGATYTLDSDCTLSHEVLTGGGVSVTTGGADVEIRGITRSIELVLSGAGTVQTDVVTGPITISGTATTTVNLYGVSSSLADTSINTTVTDATVSSTNVVDEFESQSQADPTGFHVNVVEWLSQACAAVSANGVPEVDITRLAGSTDGITGLIDFCTNGYDIITSKVAGVVLVDTTTTNADMRGTDGANTTKTGYSLGSTGLNLVLVDGETLPSALQIIAASVIGKISGAGTATEIFVGLDGNTTRATVTVDVDGNRTNVVYV
jgi:hypothetical protein